jgi:hypothetical protein
MLVRRLRRRSFASLSDQTRSVFAAKLAGGPQIEVAVSQVTQEDSQAFIAAWNKVQSKCKQAGLEGALSGVRIQVQDGGRFVARYAKGQLVVNLGKFSKNALAPEIVAHELGRRLWAKNLSEGQRKELREAHKGKDVEYLFAKTFRAKLFAKSKVERWEEFRL